MSAMHLLMTEIAPRQGRGEALASQWACLPDGPGVAQRAVFLSLDGATVLELCALASLGQIEALSASWEQAWAVLGEEMDSDFRRQLLSFVEAPKDSPQALPTTDYLQLRHVEVPPARFAEYRQWRERTIFDVVRSSPEVEQFLAYHSAVSAEPGVMFLSGFCVAPQDYAATFDSPRYQQIVKEAGMPERRFSIEQVLSSKQELFYDA